MARGHPQTPQHGGPLLPDAQGPPPDDRGPAGVQQWLDVFPEVAAPRLHEQTLRNCQLPKATQSLKKLPSPRHRSPRRWT